MSGTSKKKGQKKRNAPAIRLSRTSSARGVLSAAEHEDFELYDSKATKGSGLPNKHALSLLERMFKEVNEPFYPVGLSFYDKVNSIKVDNASKLLGKTTWREFFKRGNESSNVYGRETRSFSSGEAEGGGKADISHQQQQNAHAQQDLAAAAAEQEKTNQYQQQNLQQKEVEDEDPMHSTFAALCRRIELLWKEVKISPADRKFYRQSLLRGPCDSWMRCRLLSEYIEELLDYRSSVIEVLRCITQREVRLY